VDIPGATSSNLVLTAVQGRQEGVYSVMVSNALGTASSEAYLSVNDGLVTAIVTPLLTMSNQWRYHAQGVDLGTAWRFPAFDDSSWPPGLPLFAVETPDVYPDPIRTPLSINTTNGIPISAYYLRTRFTLPDLGLVQGLFASVYADDGAVWYLNGREAGRLRIAANSPVDEVAYTNRASNLNTEGVPSFLSLPLTNLVAGENLIAVQLHQGNIPSSDIVFGMTLEYYTVIINQPVMHMDGMSPGGAQVGLTGISGRDYAIDVSTNLVDWSHLVTWTNFTGAAQYFDAAAGANGNRFYRGRVAQ
jgi:hypothetical protein